MYCIGLTGAIGSGKSTVARSFERLGIATIQADHIAKQLTERNQSSLDKIVAHFGPSILTPEGDLNRRALRQLIFSEEKSRQWLEHLLHPLIRREIECKLREIMTPYCLIELPLLENKANYPYLNRILLVEAPPEQQLSRVIKRDHCSREQAIAILATQPNQQTRRDLADDQLTNNGSLEDLQKNIEALHLQYLQYAKAK